MSPVNIKDAWIKWVADLSGTRQQITLGVVGVIVATAIRGIMLINTMQDVVTLLGALFPYGSVVLAWWAADKIRATVGTIMEKRNGNGVK